MKILTVLVVALALAAFASGTAAAVDAKPQTQCPVLGGNIDKSIYVDYQGRRIYFCCTGCDAEFKNNPDKYLKKLQEQGVTPEPSPAGPAKK